MKLCDGMRNMVVACTEDCKKSGVASCAVFLGKKFGSGMEALSAIENCLK
jgi:hypothetical protein